MRCSGIAYPRDMRDMRDIDVVKHTDSFGTLLHLCRAEQCVFILEKCADKHAVVLADREAVMWPWDNS